MHEYAIAEAVLEVALDHAAGRRVAKIHMKIGYLRQVVPSALRFGFEIAARGTPAEGAALELEEVPAVAACVACGAESELAGFPYRCGACGGVEPRMLRGEELQVESLELEDETAGAGRAGDAVGGGGREAARVRERR